MSPLLSVCVAYGNCARTPLIAELIACGADPSVDRFWFATGSPEDGGSAGNVGSLQPRSVSRRLDAATRHAMAALCQEPRRLETLSACVVRQCLAAAEFNGVMKNADSLPVPTTIKAMLKLEHLDI